MLHAECIMTGVMRLRLRASSRDCLWTNAVGDLFLMGTVFYLLQIPSHCLLHPRQVRIIPWSTTHLSYVSLMTYWNSFYLLLILAIEDFTSFYLNGIMVMRLLDIRIYCWCNSWRINMLTVKSSPGSGFWWHVIFLSLRDRRCNSIY